MSSDFQPGFKKLNQVGAFAGGAEKRWSDEDSNEFLLTFPRSTSGACHTFAGLIPGFQRPGKLMFALHDGACLQAPVRRGLSHVCQIPQVRSDGGTIRSVKRQAYEQFQPSAQRIQHLDRQVGGLLRIASGRDIGKSPRCRVGLTRPSWLKRRRRFVKGDHEFCAGRARARQIVPVARSMVGNRHARAMQRANRCGMYRIGEHSRPTA